MHTGVDDGQDALLLAAEQVTLAVPANSKPVLQANVATLACRCRFEKETEPSIGASAPAPAHFVSVHIGSGDGVGQA